MRRFLMMIFILILAGSCGAFPILFLTPASAPTLTALPSLTSTIHTSKTFTPAPSLTPSPLASPITPSPTSTNTPSTQAFKVLYHPDDVLYVGDQVSFEVIAPPGLDVKSSDLRVQVDPATGPDLGPTNFTPWGIQGRDEATLLWAWNTSGLEPGKHTLSFSVQPQGYDWTDQVTLLPAGTMPPDQAAAYWVSTQTQCCAIFYITDTASERDLPSIISVVDAQAQDVIDKMGADFTQPITITVLPRLLGHGGFTTTEISVSYLDRNYASNDWSLVVHHEMIHAIDGQLGGDFRPTIFVEGLAVYMTGGHYKPEPLMPRAAALLPAYLNQYIPLKTLADDFYASQHEIGYLEGASLIEYMVNTYGWGAFSSFYRDIHSHPGESQSASIDASLKVHFSTTLSQLEQGFLTALKNEPDTPHWVDDVRLTVTYYDTMRHYQQLLDPSAYFRTAWLLDNKTMRDRGIVADYLRHPHTPVNLTLETLFITAGKQIAVRDYTSAVDTLNGIDSVLDAIEHDTTDPFSTSPLSVDYLSISDMLLQQGYEVQSITTHGDSAVVNVTTSTTPDLTTLNLQRSGGQWSISP